MASMLGKFFKALSGAPQHKEAEAESSPYLRKEEEPIDFIFAQKFTEGGGYLVYCNTVEEVTQNLKALAEETGETHFFIPEENIQHWFKAAELGVIPDNPLDANAMASSCHAAMASTGGIMITDAQTHGIKFAQLPAIHVVFASVSQIVRSLSDGMTKVNRYHKLERPRSIMTLKGKLDDSVAKAKVDPNKGRDLYFFLLEDELLA